jgi:hypothetical protein
MFDEIGCLDIGLVIVISFWSISPFISMEYHSLSHLINVGLKQYIVLLLLPVFGGHWLGKSSSSISS